MKKNLLLILTCLLIFTGCLNENSSSLNDNPKEISFEIPKIKVHKEELIKNSRAISLGGYFYGFADKYGWNTEPNAKLNEDLGKIYFLIISNKPGSIRYASLKNYTITNEIKHELDDEVDGYYYTYYSIKTADIRSHFSPVINATMSVRFHNGSSFIYRSSLPFSLYPYYN